MDYNGTRDYPTMHLLNLAKAVTIMSYHDSDQIIRKTRYPISYAAAPEVGTLVYASFDCLLGYSYFRYSTYHDLPD